MDMKQPKDKDPGHRLGSRPPEYVIVVSASQRLNGRDPGIPMSLAEALRVATRSTANPKPIRSPSRDVTNI